MPDLIAPIRLAEALERVRRRCQFAIGTETAPLGEAGSRFLADDIAAPIAVPPADNSAMDGYAFRHADLPGSGDGSFRLIGVAAAGRPFQGAVGLGEAVRIFTGAIPPPGTDSIAMQEVVRREGDNIMIPSSVTLHNNVRRAGEDIAVGQVVLTAGQQLGPIEIGMLASLGIAGMVVRKRLRVAVLSAGDELIAPGAKRKDGQIHDSNRPSLLALLRRLGMQTTDLGIVPDRRDAIRDVLKAAAQNHDAIVTSAGMSVGDEDHVRAVVESLGSLDFWRIAIKPGKPIAVGHVAGVPFFGLPGNPVAMMIAFLFIARPGLLRLAGADDRAPRRFPVPVDFVAKRQPGRREFLRCVLHDGADGRVAARRYLRGGSGILSSFAGADGLIEVAEDMGAVTPGMILPFIPLAEFGL